MLQQRYPGPLPEEKERFLPIWQEAGLQILDTCVTKTYRHTQRKQVLTNTTEHNDNKMPMAVSQIICLTCIHKIIIILELFVATHWKNKCNESLILHGKQILHNLLYKLKQIKCQTILINFMNTCSTRLGCDYYITCSISCYSYKY